MKHTSTRLLLNNNPANPVTMSVKWTADSDGHGWRGEVVVWKDHNEKLAEGHRITIRQGQPLGSISMSFDEAVGAGAWKFYSFEGTGITERDLQWATAWAALALRDKLICSNKKPLY